MNVIFNLKDVYISTQFIYKFSIITSSKLLKLKKVKIKQYDIYNFKTEERYTD